MTKREDRDNPRSLVLFIGQILNSCSFFDVSSSTLKAGMGEKKKQNTRARKPKPLAVVLLRR